MSFCSRNLRDARIVIEDGTTPTANTLAIVSDNGDLNWTESTPFGTIKHRGVLDHRRDGDEEEMEVSFSVVFSQYAYNSGASTGIGILDALYQRNGAAAWESTHADDCSPYSVDLVFHVKDPETDGAEEEVLRFPKFRPTSVAFREGDPSTLQVSGRAFATKPDRTYGAV